VKNRVLSGFVNLLEENAVTFSDELGVEPTVTEIPEEMRKLAAKSDAILVERIAETDDDLTLKFLEGETISLPELKSALRAAVLANKATPVFCGSSLRNKGVQAVLDAVIDYLPSPLDIPPVNAKLVRDGSEVLRHADPSEPLSALVFKIVADPYVGRLAYFRVYSGKIATGDMVYNPVKGRKERIGRLLRMYADRREDISEVNSGDIGAVLGLKESFTGDTLCNPNQPVVLESISFPEPVISIAVEPKSTADQDKMANALQRLSEEDPTFRVRSDENTGQTIISGMGELHLDVLVDRMLREFRVQANVGQPKVSYRETISRPVEKVNYKYAKQSGGHGQYGHVKIEIEPAERGAGFEFVDKIVGGVIPRNFIPSVEKGIREAMKKGVLAAFPVVDVRVTLFDGSYHEVDSSDISFQIAAIQAFKKGMQQAKPVLLEPVMHVEVYTPDENAGDVMGEISSRRGRPMGMEPAGKGITVVKAEVPLAEMLDFQGRLSSITSGRGYFTMRFIRYDVVPPVAQDRIIAERQKVFGKNKPKNKKTEENIL